MQDTNLDNIKLNISLDTKHFEQALKNLTKAMAKIEIPAHKLKVTTKQAGTVLADFYMQEKYGRYVNE